MHLAMRQVDTSGAQACPIGSQWGLDEDYKPTTYPKHLFHETSTSSSKYDSCHDSAIKKSKAKFNN